MLLKQQNAFNSRNSTINSSNRSRNKERFLNKSININKSDNFDEKAKTYVAEKEKNDNDQNNENNDEKYSNDKNDTYYFEEMNYYESYNVSKENDDNAIYLIIFEILLNFRYKHCKIIFLFNNKLHQHLRNVCVKRFNIIIIKNAL